MVEETAANSRSYIKVFCIINAPSQMPGTAGARQPQITIRTENGDYVYRQVTGNVNLSLMITI